ncbi:Adenosylcobalamin/alpha-ribazole phosphatase [Meiothermus luteus]|jgi:2,3-bisphosphoglycerate-dependent phosphoglycerate mutase|uniref:Adenosylcobalamin/alpha-ribazole phosphatase n=1 Tax=Meiothermus luteus TaxID=2026184 RepID=A0A399EEL0_9DEIN|nr:histidine phosphatase family protein [Meiothermus luteus]RIH82348.1 Adenosylcobalamin/alpha-ribazole phosphatase [Meiothermus luteus]RMH57569.1 MAG: histidine phosphatase family protein [Deinococcota bacterium]
MSILRLTLLRHGRSLADDLQVHEGRYDAPLTEQGLAQARARLEAFRAQNLCFDRVISSPLQRARAVAEVMSQGLGVPLELDPDWMEQDNGAIAGLSFEEGARRFPESFRNPYEKPFGGTGESEWETYSRAARAVQNLVNRGAGSYLVVAHGKILNCALRVIMGIPPSPKEQGIWFSFADLGYAVLEYQPSRHIWRLDGFEMGFNTLANPLEVAPPA